MGFNFLSGRDPNMEPLAQIVPKNHSKAVKVLHCLGISLSPFRPTGRENNAGHFANIVLVSDTSGQLTL